MRSFKAKNQLVELSGEWQFMSMLNTILSPSDNRIDEEQLSEACSEGIRSVERYMLGGRPVDSDAIEGFRKELELRSSCEVPVYYKGLERSRGQWREHKKVDTVIRRMRKALTAISPDSLTLAQIWVREEVLRNLEYIKRENKPDFTVKIHDVEWNQNAMDKIIVNPVEFESLPNNTRVLLITDIQLANDKDDDDDDLKYRIGLAMRYCDKLIYFYFCKAPLAPWNPGSTLYNRLQYHECREKYVFTSFYHTLKRILSEPVENSDIERLDDLLRFIQDAKMRLLNLPYLILWRAMTHDPPPESNWFVLKNLPFDPETQLEIDKLGEKIGSWGIEAYWSGLCSMKILDTMINPKKIDDLPKVLKQASKFFHSIYEKRELSHEQSATIDTLSSKGGSLSLVLHRMGYGLSAISEVSNTVLYQPSKGVKLHPLLGEPDGGSACADEDPKPQWRYTIDFDNLDEDADEIKKHLEEQCESIASCHQDFNTLPSFEIGHWEDRHVHEVQGA